MVSFPHSCCLAGRCSSWTVRTEVPLRRPCRPCSHNAILGSKKGFQAPSLLFPTFHTPPTMMQRFWSPPCAHKSPNQPDSWLFGQQVFLTELNKRNQQSSLTETAEEPGRSVSFLGARSLRTVQGQVARPLVWEQNRGQVCTDFFSLRLEPKAGEVGPGQNPSPPL